MRTQIAEYIKLWLDLISQLGLWLVAFSTPLLFWTLTSEFYETPKFLLLAAVTGLLLILLAARWLVDGQVTITRTPLDIPLLLLLAVVIISTFFATSRSVAILGNWPRIHGGLATFVVYILYYFVAVANLRQIGNLKPIVYSLLISATILSVLSLLAYFGLNLLPVAWATASNFTLTGSNFSTTALLALLLPFPLLAILQKGNLQNINKVSSPALSAEGIWNKYFNQLATEISLDRISAKTTWAILLTLFSATIVLTGSLPAYLASLAALALVFFVTPPQVIQKGLPWIAPALVVTIVLAVISFTTVGGDKNIFYSRAKNRSPELQLSFVDSWKISVSAFRDRPFWGSGPASYLNDFTLYKPLEFNNTKTWNIRFDQAFNEYLQYLGTMGALGLIAFLIITVVFISVAAKSLVVLESSLGLAVAVSGIIFFVLLALHTSTVTLWVVGVLLLAGFIGTRPELARQIRLGSHLPTMITKTENELGAVFDALADILFIGVLLLVGFGFYQIGKATLADYHHRQALLAVSSGQGLVAYNELVVAERLNPNIDLYHINLAQTNFALANAIAAAKGPTEASPGGSLTDQDKLNIQTLLSQAINEGRLATALNPDNPGNWEVLGTIYRQISGVAQNALSFALDSYGRAIQRDPLNPLLRLAVGGVYYSVKNYDLAIRFFTDTINLKPDFANGYYNLAYALKDKGDLQGAIFSAEKTVSLLEPSSTDYKAASEFLASLKDQIAKAEQAKTQTPPPAAQSSSSLENKNLPKVLELPKPENIATPPAVKKPTPTPTP